jgi:flagellar hook protein FlgE
MLGIFNTALSGLNAMSNAVAMVGNNLANLNTAGYKANTASFSEMMDTELGVGQSSGTVGSGVVAQVTKHFTQGGVQETSGAFDAAIQGEGFFVVRDSNNQQLFTRAGNFAVDATGHLITATGQYVQGWSASGGALNVNGPIGDIVVPLNGMNGGTPTTNMSIAANLDAGAVVGTAGATYSAPIQVVDSLGATHTLTVTFTKTDVNTWDYAVSIAAADLTDPAGSQLATGTLTFDSQGLIPGSTAAVDLDIAGLANGAADQTVTWNIVENGVGLLTQFAQKSGVSGTKQDGMLAGQITSVGIADGGLIVAKFSSGQQQAIGQLALASISNPDSLVAVGGNNYASTPGSAAATLGAPETGGRGKVLGGSLEGSTVDLAAEFTNLITFQRSYAANSRVITTSDEMLQEVMNLKR